MRIVPIISIVLMFVFSGCIPGTRVARTYQDRMTGKNIIDSGDFRLSTNIVGQNIYVGYTAQINTNGEVENIVMEVTYNNFNWIYYDSCWIKIDSNEIIKNSDINTAREVIGANNIMERGRFNIKKETLIAIANCGNGLIRTVGAKAYAEAEISNSLKLKTKEFARKLKILE